MPPLDLGRMNPLSPAFRTDVHSRIGSVPGCSLVHVHNTADDVRADLVMNGWSPSLHEVQIDVTICADPGRDYDYVLEQLDAILGLQRLRAAAGLALGTPFPLDHSIRMSNMLCDGEGPEIRHLWIDRSAIATTLARFPDLDKAQIIRRAIVEPLSRLHENPRGGCFHQMSGNGIAFTDETGLPVVETTFAVTRTVTANGAELIVEGRTVPSTAAVILEGRPLEQLIDLGPHYAGRTIEAVKAYETHMVVDLVPELVRMDAVLESVPESG